MRNGTKCSCSEKTNASLPKVKVYLLCFQQVEPMLKLAQVSIELSGMLWFAAHHDVRVDTLGRSKLVKEISKSRETLLVAVGISAEHLRLCSKGGARVDWDALRRLQVL